jgi:hypothetical protein
MKTKSIKDLIRDRKQRETWIAVAVAKKSYPWHTVNYGFYHKLNFLNLNITNSLDAIKNEKP